MEALATANPTRFSEECQSLARPVASCVLLMMENGAAAAAAVPVPDANGEEEETPETEPSATGTDEKCSENGGKFAANRHTAAGQQALSANGNAAAIEERKALELWVDLFGICLLPFCNSCSSGGRRGGGGGSNNEPGAAGADAGAPDAVQGNDPFDSDSDSDNEEEEEEEGADGGDDAETSGGGFSGGGNASSGRVAGRWMRRSGSALAEPLECPLDVRPGGQDEELPRRLAAFIAAHAKVQNSCNFFFVFVNRVCTAVRGRLFWGSLRGKNSCACLLCLCPCLCVVCVLCVFSCSLSFVVFRHAEPASFWRKKLLNYTTHAVFVHTYVRERQVPPYSIHPPLSTPHSPSHAGRGDGFSPGVCVFHGNGPHGTGSLYCWCCCSFWWYDGGRARRCPFLEPLGRRRGGVCVPDVPVRGDPRQQRAGGVRESCPDVAQGVGAGRRCGRDRARERQKGRERDAAERGEGRREKHTVQNTERKRRSVER